MKKVLSVLIAAIMLISCCSVGLVSFAASQPASLEEAVALIAQDTEFLTSSPAAIANPGAWNERAFQYGTAGYTFSRTVNPTSTNAAAVAFTNAFNVTNDNGTPDDTSDDTNNLNTIKANIAKAYKETGAYADYIIPDSTNPSAMKDVDLAKLASDIVDLTSAMNSIDVPVVANTVINKSMDASKVLGDDALTKVEIDPADVVKFASQAMTFADIVVASDDETDVLTKIEDSSLAKLVKTLISSDVAAQLKADLVAKEGVKDVKEYNFKITNVKVTPTYATNTKYSTSEDIECMGNTYTKNTAYTTLSGLKISYDISFTANVAFDAFSIEGVEDSYFTYSGKKVVTQNYASIQRPTEVDLKAADVIALINSETARLTDPAHSAGYALTKTVSASTPISLDSNNKETLNNIIKTKYADRFAAYINEIGEVNYDGILCEVLGLNAVTGKVGKSVAGTEILGKDALMATKLSVDDLKSFTGTSLNAGITLNFKDVDLLAADKVSEESVIGDFYANVVPSGTDKVIANDVSFNAPGTTVEDVSIKYTNISIVPQFAKNDDTNAYELSTLKLTYNVEFSANVYAVNAVAPIPVKSVTTVVVNYTNINPFVEGVDIDAYKFAEILNEATGYAVADKAGYDYERNSAITSAPAVTAVGGTTVMDAITAIDGLLGTITSMIGGSGTPITDALANKMKEILSEDLNATDYVGKVNPTQNAVEALGANGANYAVKASKVEAKDIYDLQYNAERGVITFTLADTVNPEKDDSNALSRLTNDFTSVSEIKEKLAVSLSEDLKIEFMKDTDPCKIAYTNIKCYVAFNGADAENVYGDGTLAKLGVNYNCSLDVTAQGLKFVAGQTVLSESNNFKYVDYELGDADQSGKVSIVDAKLVLEYVVGTATLNDEQMKLADMDANGKVNVTDAKLILQKVASQTA